MSQGKGQRPERSPGNLEDNLTVFPELGLVVEAGNSLYSTTQEPEEEGSQAQGTGCGCRSFGAVLAWHAPSLGPTYLLSSPRLLPQQHHTGLYKLSVVA